MIQSMTGFGKAVTSAANKKITVEIKSLNSKQLDLSVRLPQAYRAVELDIRNTIAKEVERGKVELNISTECQDTPAATINIPLLKTYKLEIEHLAAELGIDPPADWYATLLRLPDALKSDAVTISEEEIQALNETVMKAIAELNSFRSQEGERLFAFFKEKIEAIRQLLAQVEPYEEERVPKIKARIQEALQKIGNVDIDNNRFEQEMIYYIEKLDITEEKLRLTNHLNYFLTTLENDRAQGKALGFIAQEMGREINTLGSKANQAEMQKIVVKMKDHLEQIKEQVLNVL